MMSRPRTATPSQDNGPLNQLAAPEPIDALARLPQSLAIIKMDNDSMIAMAAAAPRDYSEIVKDIKDQLQHFKQFAVSAMYAKPVGVMETCPACGADNRGYSKVCPNCRRDIPQKIARGLSIRAAEALATSYKYNRMDSEVEDIEAGEKVRLTVSFVDYQTGRVVRDSTIVSKSYKDRNGATRRIPDDRFYNVVLKARKSIMIRDAVMKMVPPGMRSELETCVNEQLAAFLDDNTLKAIIANFSQRGVSPEMLEKFMGKRMASFTKEDRITLASVWTSLEDGEASVEEVFGKPEGAQTDQKKGATEGLADRLTKPAKQTEKQAEKPAEKKPETKSEQPSEKAPGVVTSVAPDDQTTQSPAPSPAVQEAPEPDPAPAQESIFPEEPETPPPPPPVDETEIKRDRINRIKHLVVELKGGKEVMALISKHGFSKKADPMKASLDQLDGLISELELMKTDQYAADLLSGGESGE